MIGVIRKRTADLEAGAKVDFFSILHQKTLKNVRHPYL